MASQGSSRTRPRRASWLSQMTLNCRRNWRLFCPFVQRSQVCKWTSGLQSEREVVEIGIFSRKLERENEWNKSFPKIKQRERKREQKWEFFGQNWSGEAIEEKEKEILNPRKFFSLLFLFPGKVEWEFKKLMEFSFWWHFGNFDNWVIGWVGVYP